jgi:hypothetical protein
VRIIKSEEIVHAGRFPRNRFWRRALVDIESAIGAADWPFGSGTFSLNANSRVDAKGKPDKHPNGVLPIKVPMLAELESRGWLAEKLPPLPVGTGGIDLLSTGDLDALLEDRGRYVGFEWATGNISSSHRAINKLLDGITRGTLMGGVLVLPVRATQRYLTDRIGNFEELAPYFEFWRRYPVNEGALRVYGVGHDKLDSDVPYIPKGKAGRALVKQWRAGASP